MKKIIPIFLGLLFVFLIVEILLLSPSDLDLVVDKKDGQGLMSNNASADQIMRGVHLMEASEGHREWELWSDTAISFKSANRWELEKVKVIFFSDKGDFTVTGKKGFINTDTKDLEVHGDVEVHSKNGYVFYTQKTNYISKQKKLISPTSVKMFGPKDERGFRMNLVGDGLESLVKTSFIEILGNVKAVKTVNKDKTINIKSKRAQLSGASDFVQFIEDVIMDMNDLRISGNNAKFNYSDDKKLVESIFMKGNIRASDKDKWATAETATAYLEEDRFTFKGDPRLVQGADELRGEEIIYLKGGEEVQVKGANMKLNNEKSSEE